MASIDRVMALADEINKKKKKKDYEINTSIVNVNDIANEMKRGNTKAIKEFNYNPNNFIIKNNDNEKKWYQEILQVPEVFKGKLDRFDDGYQFGDITKTAGETIGDTLLTVGGTVGDLGLGIVKGILNVGEGIGDAISYGGAQVLDWVGKDEKADEIRERASKDIFNEAFKKPQSFVNKASIIGDTGDKVSEGIGYMASIWASGYIGGAAGTAVSGGAKAAQIGSTIGQSSLIFTNSTGTNMADIYDQYGVDGVTDGEAWGKSLGSAAIETTTEQLFGMFGNVDTKFVNAMSNRAKTALGSVLTRAGIQAGGEGFEEIISFAGNHVWDRIVDAASKGEGATFAQEVSWEEMWEQAGIAAITALSMGGGQTSAAVLNNKTSNNTWSNALSKTAKQQNASAQVEDLNSEIEELNKQIKKTTDATQLQKLQNELEWKQKQLNSLQQQNTAPIENTTQQNNMEEVLPTANQDISQDTEKNILKVKNKLNKNGTFENQLELYKNGQMKSSDLLYVGQTPEIYTKLGLKENPITLLQRDLKKVITEGINETSHEHGISIDTLKNLPQALENPLNVLSSKDKKGRDCIVVITDLADTNERPIIASILINDDGQIGSIHFDTNRLTSIYGKNDYDDYMKRQIEAGNMLYDIDEGIIKESPASTRLQVPKGLDSFVDTNNNVSTSNNSITPQNENVNYTNKYAQQEQNNTQNKEKIAPVEGQQNEEVSATSEETQEKIAEILPEIPRLKSKDQRFWTKFRAGILDKGSIFEDLSLITNNRELMGKWDYMLTSEARAQNAMLNGTKEFDSTTKTEKQVSKSLYDTQTEIGDNIQAFSNYLYHKHNISRMTLDERYGIDNKPVFANSVTAEVSQKIVDKYENNNPEFMDWAKDVYDYNKANLNQLVKSGIISQETADKFTEMYPYYVPIARANVDGYAINVPLDTNRTGVNAPIKKAKGGNKDILPLFDTMARRTLQTYKAIAKNNFGVELKNTLNSVVDNQETNVDEILENVDQQDELLKEGKNGKAPTFTVFENGEKVTYEITKDMYDALKPISDSSILSTTFKPFNKISNFHRGVLTEYNPVFMLVNAIKDPQDMLMNSQHPAKTYAKFGEAYAQIIKKGYWYQEYMANGGVRNSYFDSQEGTFNTEDKGLTDIFPLKQISKLNNLVEMAPRLAEYIASREAGRSIEVSMLDAARVTTNFKAGGDITKWANRNGATFLNASIQGAMQQVRNVREAHANGLKGYANLALKFTLAGLPAILLNGLLWDDDEEYEELSAYVKQNYYIVGKYGDGNFIRIPKGRMVSVIQESFNQMKHLITGDDEADLGQFLEILGNNLAPNNPIQDNVLSPIIQAATNTTWYGDDLVPTRLQDEPVEEQFDESTDNLSIFLGEHLGISPYKINYVLDQYSGGIGDIFLPMMTQQAENSTDSLLSELIAPLTDKFTVDSVMKNQNVSDLYEKSEELTSKANSTSATDEDILQNKYLNSIKSEMNELYRQKREIQNSSLSNSKKYEKVREIQEKINNMAKDAMNNYKNIKKTNNYATVGNKEYYLKDDTWAKVENDELAELKSLNMSIKNKSTYFKLKGEINKIKISDAENKKAQIATVVKNTNLTDEQKAYVYGKYYASDKTLDMVINSGITFNEYLNFASQEFVADKDSNGKSINGSRKTKVIKYINSLQLSIPQKAMLIRTEYSTFDSYNKEIIEYVKNLKIDYTEKVSILEGLGMKVDNGKTTW